jgi:hypothetical protein
VGDLAPFTDHRVHHAGTAVTSDQSAVTVKPKAAPALPSKEKLEAAFTAILDVQEFHVQPFVEGLTEFLADSERRRPKPAEVLEVAVFLADARSELARMTRALDVMLDSLANFKQIAEGDKWAGRTLPRYIDLGQVFPIG